MAHPPPPTIAGILKRLAELEARIDEIERRQENCKGEAAA